jgi:hypothetical protein
LCNEFDALALAPVLESLVSQPKGGPGVIVPLTLKGVPNG